MTVTVLAILETDFRPDVTLGKMMNERLKKVAAELQDLHFADLKLIGQRTDDLVVYLSYNPKYAIRWRIVNDVPAEVEQIVEEICGKQGFIKWKTAVLNVFKGNE